MCGPQAKKSPEGVNARRDERPRVRSVLDAAFDTLTPNLPELMRALSLLSTVPLLCNAESQRDRFQGEFSTCHSPFAFTSCRCAQTSPENSCSH